MVMSCDTIVQFQYKLDEWKEHEEENGIRKLVSPIEKKEIQK